MFQGCLLQAYSIISKYSIINFNLKQQQQKKQQHQLQQKQQELYDNCSSSNDSCNSSIKKQQKVPKTQYGKHNIPCNHIGNSGTTLCHQFYILEYPH